MRTDEFSEEARPIKKFIVWFVVFLLVVSGVVVFINKTTRTVEKGIVQYEQFQDIYNTCNKINTDICNKLGINDDDQMFENFSKSSQLYTLQTNLNRWVEEYNAKSKTWTRSMWKSKTLPYQLSVEDFDCYQKSKNKTATKEEPTK